MHRVYSDAWKHIGDINFMALYKYQTFGPWPLCLVLEFCIKGHAKRPHDTLSTFVPGVLEFFTTFCMSAD